MRLLCTILCAGDAFLKQLARTAKTGKGPSTRLAGVPSELHPEPSAVGRVHLKLLGYNLERLATQSSVHDAQRIDAGNVSAHEALALRARIRQREQLGKWRRKVCHEYGLPYVSGGAEFLHEPSPSDFEVSDRIESIKEDLDVAREEARGGGMGAGTTGAGGGAENEPQVRNEYDAEEILSVLQMMDDDVENLDPGKGQQRGRPADIS